MWAWAHEAPTHRRDSGPASTVRTGGGSHVAPAGGHRMARCTLGTTRAGSVVRAGSLSRACRAATPSVASGPRDLGALAHDDHDVRLLGRILRDHRRDAERLLQE